MKEPNGSAMIGLAVGDALAWPSVWQRSRQLPAWTRRRARELMAFGDEQSLTDQVVPFGLNVTAEALLPAPGETTDWVADTWWSVRSGIGIERCWQARAERVGDGEPVAGRISAMTALDELAAGRQPLGSRNPHGHDDGAALRAVGIAAAGGDDEAVARDAAITNHGEAVASALVVAEVVRRRGRGESAEPGTWLDRLPAGRLHSQLVELLPLADSAADPWTLALSVARRMDTVYSYADLAGDTVAAALTLAAWAFARPDDPRAQLMAMVGVAGTLSRQAGSVCPLLGALLAPATIPDDWYEAVRRPSGCALPWASLIDLAEEDAAPHRQR